MAASILGRDSSEESAGGKKPRKEGPNKGESTWREVFLGAGDGAVKRGVARLRRWGQRLGVEAPRGAGSTQGQVGRDTSKT